LGKGKNFRNPLLDRSLCSFGIFEIGFVLHKLLKLIDFDPSSSCGFEIGFVWVCFFVARWGIFLHNWLFYNNLRSF